MKYFLDTEFIERGSACPIDLISIGLVAEDGREYYAVKDGFDRASCNEWVKANVLSCLPPEPLQRIYVTTQQFKESVAYGQGWRTKDLIVDEILEFVGNDASPEFWGEWCSYDWVVFCQLFGTMMGLPKGWPMRCRDVVQFLEDDLGLSQAD